MTKMDKLKEALSGFLQGALICTIGGLAGVGLAELLLRLMGFK